MTIYIHFACLVLWHVYSLGFRRCTASVIFQQQPKATAPNRVPDFKAISPLNPNVQLESNSAADDISKNVLDDKLDATQIVNFENQPKEDIAENNVENPNLNISDDENELLYYHSQYRNRARRTVNGYLCAAAFVHANNVYTDCTIEPAPDGTTDKEWCYLEAQLIGKLNKDWDFCEPPINYDVIRSAATSKINKKVAKVQELRESLQHYRKLLLESSRRLEHACGLTHKNIGLRLSKIEELLNKTEEGMGVFRSNINTISQCKSKIEACHCQQKQYEQKRKTYGNGENSLAVEGLLGTYFRGHLFRPPAVSTRQDPQINMVFMDTMPILGLDPNNFSIRWEGYVHAPHSGHFVFEVETDAHVRMFLQNQVIINNAIVSLGDETTGYYPNYIDVDMWRKSEKFLKSPSIQLVGGNFYSIKIEFSHSQQYKVKHGNESFIKLYWSSFRIKREIIPAFNLSTLPVEPHVSVSGLPPSHFKLVRAKNGELAFMDSEEYFIANMDPTLQDSLAVVTNYINNSNISFFLQAHFPSELYIVYKNDDNDGDVVTDKKNAKSIKENGGFATGIFPLELHGDHTLVFEPSHIHIDIYRKDQRLNFIVHSVPLAPNIKYGFTHNPYVAPYLMFIKSHDRPTFKCEGKSVLVSLPNSGIFASCRQSSAHSSQHDCYAAFAGKFLDIPGAIWRTSQGIGSWIEVNFINPIMVTQLQYRPRDVATTWPSKLTLDFGQGRIETLKLMHSSNVDDHAYPLQSPSITDTMRIYIEEMYIDSNETGGSFGIYGIPCKLPQRHASYTVSECSNTLKDTLGEDTPIVAGLSVQAECSNACIDSLQQQSAEFFNNGYNIDELLCAAFAHSNLCKTDAGSRGFDEGGTCVLQVMVDVADDANENTNNSEALEETSEPSNNEISSEVRMVFNLSPIPHMKTTAKFSIQVLFTNDRSGASNGDILFDNGKIKAKSGEYIFGWLRQARVGEECSSDNPLYSAGVAFPPPSESQKCVQTTKCEANYWSMDLIHDGRYYIKAVLGSPCSKKEQYAYLEANGHSLADGVVFKMGELYTITKHLDIRNGMLKLTSTCRGSNDTCDVPPTIIQLIKVKLIKQFE